MILACISTITFTIPTAQQDPATFQCTKDSPVSPPVWSTGAPPVEMRHIFCGEIDYYSNPTGFHSASTQTNWQTCVVVKQCQVFPSTNGYCASIYIYDSRIGSYEPKESSSTLWPTSRSPAQLVPMFQYLYSHCQPATYNALLCFPDCHWQGNANGFDIVIGTRGDAIVTAFPAQEGTCLNDNHHHWQDCYNQYCQGL